MYNPTPAGKQSSGKYFLIAFGLLNTLVFTLLLCWLGLLFGETISKWQFPLGCILAFIANYFAAKFFIGQNTTRFFVKSSIILIALVAGSLLVGGYFSDTSFDGQWYHQEVIYRLQQGYNPAYQQLAIPPDEVMNTTDASSCTGAYKPVADTAKSAVHPVNLKFININCFSKGTEIMQAAIYAVTNRIETGKAVNVILLVASFFLCLSFFYLFFNISPAKKWLLAALCAFNPIAIIQMCSFCVDGNNACWLLCLLVTGCLLLLQYNRYYLFLLGIIIVATINVKFTSLVFTCIYGAGFLIVLLVYKKTGLFKKVLLTGVIAAVIGIFCCGFNPYVTNLVKKHNVFYGLDETRANVLSLSPPSFLNHNRFEKLFISLSAHQGWYNNNAKSIWDLPKVPFTLNKIDIYEACDVEQNLSGLGPFFSGAMLIAIALLIIALVRFRKLEVFKYSLIAVLIILATVIIVPESWMMRFVPQLWLVPIIFLGMSQFISFRGVRILRWVLFIAMALNIAWASLNIGINLISTAFVKYQMEQLKTLNKPVKVEYCNFRTFKSNKIRFAEWGVPITQQNVTGKYTYFVSGSDTRFETPAPLPDIPKPFLIRLYQIIRSKVR